MINLEHYSEIVIRRVGLNAFFFLLMKNIAKTLLFILFFCLSQLLIFQKDDLGEHLMLLLPPALFIVDDWEERNKQLGIQCLRHILENTVSPNVNCVCVCVRIHCYSCILVTQTVFFPME